MVRVGGLEYAIDPTATAGQRISDMRLHGKPIDASVNYKVAGWAPVSEEAKNAGGEPVWDLVGNYLRDIKTVKAKSLNLPAIKGAANNPGFTA